MAIGASVVIFTFFICWGLYYIVMMLKRANSVFNEISGLVSSLKEKIERLGKLFDAIEEKIKHSASYLPLLFKGATELIEYLKKKKEAKAKKKKQEKNS